MSRPTPDQETIFSVVYLATCAPSIHNSQPWQWRMAPHSLHLFADRSRHLSATDPEARDLLLSCGAALHHLRVALAAIGWGTTVHRLPNPANSDHLAAVEYVPRPATNEDIAMAGAIAQRRTDRRRFSSWPVPEGLLDWLVHKAAEQGGILLPAIDPEDRFRLASAISEAAIRQNADPAYSAELLEWAGVGFATTEGVPATNILADQPGHGRSVGIQVRHGDTAMRAFPGGEMTSSPDYGEEDAGELLLLGTTSDDAISRLRAGEAMSAVLLAATDCGLATCPLSQPLEIGRTRQLLEERLFDSAASPQIVLRVGWAPQHHQPVPATHRRAVSEVLSPLPE